MNEVELREFANIQKELEKLLVKFEELNKKHEELKKSINKNNKKEVEELLSKLELQYAIVDNKQTGKLRTNLVLEKALIDLKGKEYPDVIKYES